MTQACGPFASIVYGNLRIVNNTWGSDRPDPPQCVFGPPGYLIGWNWAWPYANGNAVTAYPAIIFGKKPWDAHSTSSQLPARVSGIDSASVAYSVHIPATGVYNTTFDLWLTSSPSATVADITAEIMIWVGQRGLPPAGDLVGPVATPLGNARLYDGTIADSKPPHHQWRYLAFVMDTETLSGTLDLRWYLDYLVGLGAVAATDYLACVEFGNEIAYGQGVTTVNHYSINVV